eukprot:TRINITY_DN17784_c0_g1_i1.p1 TRINITY_DN17784_c0_g1~~TRINITY_DN17784_c0_g1_i1.p1  ORF type:complete len:256 (-),score=54.72 TRINITY_DN17784_c0_g1_i1:285-1052(-)
MQCAPCDCCSEGQQSEIVSAEKVRVQEIFAQAALQERKAEDPTEEDEDAFNPEMSPRENVVKPGSVIHMSVSRYENRKLGVLVDSCNPDLCFVSAMNAKGIVSEWNARCSKEQRIKKFDRLVAVNRMNAKSREMVKELKEITKRGDPLEMAFMRPRKFVASIDKTEYPELGLADYRTYEEYVTPLALDPWGALANWNSDGALCIYDAETGDAERITTASRIIEVNGVAMSGDDMLECMNGLDTMEITVLNWPDYT